MWPDSAAPTTSNTVSTTSSTSAYSTSSTHLFWTSNSATPSPETPMITLGTGSGAIRVYADGRVEFPDSVDASAREFWLYAQMIGTHAFDRAVRAEAARQIREVLPTLTGLDDYQRATLPSAVAAAIRSR